jgi:hypothetical protein
MKTIMGMVKINVRHSKPAYLIAGIIFATGYVQYILDLTVNSPGNYPIAAGNYLFLLPIFMGIFIPALNFPKIMSLGGTRMSFFKGGLLTYALVAAAVSLVSVTTRFTTDRLMLLINSEQIAGMLDLYDVFGFTRGGPVAGYFQMAEIGRAHV